MHEQTAKTQISLAMDTVWSESLLTAWINAQADLSLLGLHAILLVWTLQTGLGLNFQEFAQNYGNDNWNDKNYDIHVLFANTGLF